ncbi:MAG: c-type cytochrome [Anaerolineae bacterium]|nr:c-type cytochrome [Anaerolineae bacterium]
MSSENQTVKTASKPSRRLALPVIVASVILVLIAVPFVYELLTFDPRHQSPVIDLPETNEELETQSAALLAQGDAANGDLLIDKHGCYACHRIGAINGIAPSFEGIAARAGEGHPPLSAPAYIYESILYPMAHVVEGFDPAMPQNFAEVLTQPEIADLLAYLMSPGAQ